MKHETKIEKITEMDMKYIWWNWVLANKRQWPIHFTYPRLRKIQMVIFNSYNIWYDLFERHNMINQFPWIAIHNDRENYNHAISNFIGNIACAIHI